MFTVNDVIIYGTQGVCQIAGIEEKKVGGAKKNYFVLKPVNENGSTFFVPTDNEHALKKMRRILSEEEIRTLIHSIQNTDALWIKNDNDRKEHYRKILTNGDHAELIKTIKSIHAHKKEREAEGKRLHMIDAYFLKDAEQVLYNEFQYVLNLNSREELMAYILPQE